MKTRNESVTNKEVKRPEYLREILVNVHRLFSVLQWCGVNHLGTEVVRGSMSTWSDNYGQILLHGTFIVKTNGNIWKLEALTDGREKWFRA